MNPYFALQTPSWFLHDTKNSEKISTLLSGLQKTPYYLEDVFES